MAEQLVSLGRARGTGDGARRYRPIVVSFDTRNVVLETRKIDEDWDPDVKSVWTDMKEQVRAELAHELGTPALR